MAVELHTGHLVSRLKKHLVSARKVQIASAWLSDSGALDALLQRSNCKVQALIGIHGNSTSPESLASLAERFGWSSVRLVGPEGPLFHPKLVIIHYARKRAVAWIGSANFTGHGMEVNKELMLQTDDKGLLVKLGSWFDKHWETAPANSEERFRAYDARREPPGRFEGDRGGVPERERGGVQAVAPMPPATKLRFEPTRRRAASTFTGNLIVGPRGRTGPIKYKSHTAALRVVLDVLRSGRPLFLETCAEHRSFRVEHLDGSISRYLATDRSEIKEVRAANGELTRQAQERIERTHITPIQLADGWWLSRDMEPKANTWKMIRVAARLADVEISPDQREPGF